MLVERFIGKLKELGFDFFVGVPCSFFKSAINFVIDDPDINYHMASNEGVAIAMASGAYLAGNLPVVMLQNSGFGNMVNPLTSLSMIYKIPALLLVSGRGYKVDDQPQHLIMGTKLFDIFKGIGIRAVEMPLDENGAYEALKQATQYIRETMMPIVLVVQKGTFDDYSLKTSSARSVKDPLMTRRKAIEVITSQLQENTVVISTTGHVSRLLFVVDDRPRNFYMQGSMGHAVSIGLGIAVNRPACKVVVLDGDGAVIMHMGALSTVGHHKPKNLIHIVLDNESYESTGGQSTSSGTTDLTEVAHAAGYSTVLDVRDEPDLRKALESVLTQQIGPSFIRVLVSRGSELENLPRIPEKYSVTDTRRIFMEFLESE
jgi:phosphonopyruvate decarboxylase